MKIPHNLPPFRDYQSEIYSTLWNHYNVATAVQMPTGTGKGLIISKLIIDLIIQTKSVLVLVPTIELLDNIYDRLVAYCPFLKPMIGKMGTGRGRNINFPIVIAVYKSVASLLNLVGKLPYFHAVISDECHHGVAPQWLQVLEYYFNSWNTGFTATPSRLDGKPLNMVYQKLIKSKNLSWFIQQGYLCNFDLKTHHVDLKLSNFNDDLKEQQSFFDREGMIGDARAEWERYALGKKSLFFCTGMEHAKHVRDDFNDYFGDRYKFGYIGSDLSGKEREGVLVDYKKGHYTGLTNVGIVTEGIDIPDISCVSMQRFTKSLPLWLQCVGRALRPKVDGSNAILLDHAGNALEHGAPDFDHDWDIDPDDDSIAGYTKISCPGCSLPVISYKKLASYGKEGIAITCSNCGMDHHYQHTPEERYGNGGELPWTDTSKQLEDFHIDPITFKIAKILSSNRLPNRKAKAIVDLNCGITQKIKALRDLKLPEDTIETYLGLNSYTFDAEVLGL